MASRHVSEHPACLVGRHRPIVVLKAFTFVGGMPTHRMPCRPLSMRPALAILLVIAPVFLVELDLGALRAPPTCPPFLPRPLTRGSQTRSSQPIIELTVSVITDATMRCAPLYLSVRSSTYFVSRIRGHLLIMQSQSKMNSMWRMAHENTEPATIGAYVVTGCDADPHKAHSALENGHHQDDTRTMDGMSPMGRSPVGVLGTRKQIRVCICAGQVRVRSTSFTRSVHGCLPFSEMHDHMDG